MVTTTHDPSTAHREPDMQANERILHRAALAVVGELSWLSLVLPGATFLIPVTRFPAFVWLIAAGFALPTTRSARSE